MEWWGNQISLMKKTLLFILFSIAITASHAQVNMGVKLNWTANKFVFVPSDEQNIFGSTSSFSTDMFGLSGGLIGNYKVRPHFSVQSELIYDATHTSYYEILSYTNSTGELDNVSNGYDVKLNYLELPIMGKYSWGNKTTVDIAAGGFVGYLLSGQKSTPYGAINLPEDTIYGYYQYHVNKTLDYPTHNARSEYTSFNAGILLACGVTIDDRIILEIRLNRGLVNISKSDLTKINTLQAQLTVGWYVFRQKKTAE